MQQDAQEHWRIVAVEDDKLAEAIADSVRRDLPKSASAWQDEVGRQLKHLKPPAP
jgi:hypothetical protein